MSRQRDVQRGAETPELAGLIVDEYGRGLAKAIDPTVTENRQRRWAARPAGLQIGT